MGEQNLWTLCKTRIVFGDEHSAMSVPNRTTAVETGSLSRLSACSSAGYFTTPAFWDTNSPSAAKIKGVAARKVSLSMDVRISIFIE